ncbi:protein YgfX [Thauera linaloolentis]|uniref:protein YgfX n=1 Tax=Thauera linaloolentis TaxID=76112 RepID=UPI003312FB75
MWPSRVVMASISAVHAAAGLALFHVPSLSVLQPAPLRTLGLLLWIALLGSLLHALRRERAKRGLALVLHGDGGLGLGCGNESRGGWAGDYWLGAGAVDFGWAVWLPLLGPAAEGERASRRPRRRLMLLRANMAAAHWRPLRIWLRHKAASPPGSA